MPGTKATKEVFPSSVQEANMENEVNLRLRIGAISSKFTKVGEDWVLETLWNVLGEQD